MKTQTQILICDDDRTYHLAVKYALKGKFECRSAHNGDEALIVLKSNPIDLVMLDVEMRSDSEGLEYIARILEVDPDVAIIMSSGRTDFQTVREAMRRGASDYVAKDCGPDELEHAIRRVLERRQLRRRNEQRNFEAVELQRKHPLIGQSPAMASLRKMLDRVRTSPANVVITGETGTGKEVVARQLRGLLPDGSLRPFIAIDSATIQSSTAESLLFGHEKGAFTGAERQTKGVFEEADQGVVYFDEIGNMPLDIQAKLLRVIQEKELSRMGSAKVIPLDFRVICATNQPLEALIKAGKFKDDLFQRLNVIPLQLPPLRERTEDLGALLSHFARPRADGATLTFSPSAIAVLQQYDWPGNVRELANLVAYLETMADGPEIDVADLPPRVRETALKKASHAAGATPETWSADPEAKYYDQVAAFERALLERELAKSGENMSKLALRLGMDRSHLYSKLKEFGLQKSKG